MLGFGDWKHGTGTIVESRVVVGSLRRVEGKFRWELVVDVQPESPAAPFRARFQQYLDSRVSDPIRGDVVPVRYKSEDKVELREGELVSDAKERYAATAERFRELAERPPGTATPGPPAAADPAANASRFANLLAGGATAPPPAEPSPEATRLEQLERLAALHERGILSDAELAAEKARILGTP